MARPKPDGAFARRIGAFLHEHRMTAGMSGPQLAEASGVSNSLISMIETGQSVPSAHTLFALADVLGFSVDSLRHPPTKEEREARVAVLAAHRRAEKAEEKLLSIAQILMGQK
jgi:transcriptional regulator with XRE-family HTH domain